MNKEILKLNDEEKIDYMESHNDELQIYELEDIIQSLTTQEGIIKSLELFDIPMDTKKAMIIRLTEENIIKCLENLQLDEEIITDIVLTLPAKYWKDCLENSNINLEEERVKKAIEGEEKFSKAEEILKKEREEKGKDFIIDGDDKQIGDIKLGELVGLEFSDGGEKSDLVWVHATDYFPKNGAILTLKGAKVAPRGKFYNHSDTLHGALNHHVEPNQYRDEEIENTKYTVFEPFEQIENKKIRSVASEDSYVLGNMELSEDAVILVSEEDFENLTEEEKKDDRIIRYKGDKKNAERKVMILLGKKPQKANSNGIDYENNSNSEKIRKMQIKEQIINNGRHFHSIYRDYAFNANQRDEEIGKIRGRIIDTTEPIEIEFEEFRSIYIGEDTKEGFMKFLITRGIEYENGKFRTLKDEEAIKRYEEYSKDGVSTNIDYSKVEAFEEKYDQYNRKIRKQELLSMKIQNGTYEAREVKDEFLSIINKELQEKGIDNYIFCIFGKELVVGDSEFENIDDIDKNLQGKQHYKGIGVCGGPTLDFEEKEDETVGEYLERLEKYTDCFSKYYDGHTVDESVRFDENGDLIEEQKKPNYEKVAKSKEAVIEIQPGKTVQEIRDEMNPDKTKKEEVGTAYGE